MKQFHNHSNTKKRKGSKLRVIYIVEVSETLKVFGKVAKKAALSGSIRLYQKN